MIFFAAGIGWGITVATPQSKWTDFLGTMLLMGLGQGCVFSPMVTVALRHITPAMAGSASGVFNTTRQLGGVIGSAVVGAVFQSQLASSFQTEAITRSAQLPVQFREGFVSGFAAAMKGGLELGRSAQAGFQLPAGIPTQAAEQIQRAAHDVYGYGFVGAIGPTLAISIIVLLVAAASCLLTESQKRAAARAANAAIRETATEA